MTLSIDRKLKGIYLGVERPIYRVIHSRLALVRLPSCF